MPAAALIADPLPLQGAALLSAWEQAQGAAPAEQAVRLIAHGWPELPVAAIRSLSVAARDGYLLRLRAACFGPRLEMFFACGACAMAMEMSAPVDGFRALLDAAPERAEAVHDGYRLRVRLADSEDLAAAMAAPGDDAARWLLLTRCLDAVAEDGTAVPLDALPEPTLRVAAEAVDALHAAAEILLDNACPACGARHSVAFDAASLLWRELRHAARRLVDEVHELAWAYGWAEQSILAMSPARRAAYLERVRQ
jgi:hypothetical protein